jgi:hypothetical protein
MVALPQNPVWVIEVEGLGFVHATDGPTTWWLTDRAAGSWDTLGRCLHVLEEGGLSWDARADFRAGRSSGGGVSFSVLLPQGASVSDTLRTAFARPRPVQVGALQVALGADAGDDEVDLGDEATGLDDAVVYLGREAIWLGTEGADGVYSGCARAVLGTPLLAHPVGVGVATQCYSSWWPRDARGVTLGVISQDAASQDEVQWLMRFPLRGGGHSGLHALRLRCDGPYAVLSELSAQPRPWEAEAYRIYGLEGGGIPLKVLFKGVPQPGRDTVRLPYGVTFTGSTPDAPGADLLVWWQGGVRRLRYRSGAVDAAADSATWEIDLLDDGGQVYGGEALDPEKIGRGDYERRCRQVWVSDEAAPEPSRLPQRIGAALYTLLIEEAFGALPPSLVDAAGLAAFDDQLGPASRIDRLFVGVKEERLWSILQRELACYDATLVGGPDGWTLTRLTDSTPAGDTETSLSEPADVAGLTEDFGEDRITDRVVWRFDRSADGALTPLTAEDLGQVSAHLGADREEDYDGGSNSNAQIAFLLAFAKLDRYRTALHRVGFEAGPDHVLAPGDAVLLTSADHLVGLSGDTVTEGATSSRAVVESARYDHDRGVYGYSALRTGLAFTTQRRISQGCRVVGLTSSTLVVRNNEYTPSGSPVGSYTIDRDAWSVNDSALVVDQTGAAKTGVLTITALSGANGLTVTGLGSYAWADGDDLVPADYDTCSTVQRAIWAWHGDTDGEIPTVGDPAPQYEGL